MTPPDPATPPERTWLELPPDTGFGVDSLPLRIFSTPDAGPRTGVRVGDAVLDLWAWSHDEDHRTGSLHAFLAQGPQRWAALRRDVRGCLTDEAYRGGTEPFLVPVDEITMHLPFEVADCVDFYSSPHHAENVGRMFRPDAGPLTPNWRHQAWEYVPLGPFLGKSFASLRTGDLFASGTVSGPDRDQRGSLLELSWNGTEPLTLTDDVARTFLDDGDAVTISATAPGTGGGRISLGEVTGRVLPAR